MTKDVSIFKVGTVHNPCKVRRDPVCVGGSIYVQYPARLEAMALDPAKIATNDSFVYTAGQIDLCIELFRSIRVSYDEQGTGIVISKRTKRASLALHAGLLMMEALGISGRLIIDIDDPTAELRHCGLGSSSGTIAGVASAINELFGCPIDPHELVLYCAQNHGEEIDDDPTRLAAVQCLGGSGVCGNYDGGLILLAGEATPIGRYFIDEKQSVVIGIPNDFNHPDSKELMQKEEESMEGFVATGSLYGKEIAYRLVHEVMPALELGNLEPCKQLVFDYRWDMGSIQNCSFVFPRMNAIADRLRPLRADKSVKFIALSSVGPGFFAITDDPESIEKLFGELNMRTIRTSVYNDKYKAERV